jgi:DNA-binding XRE family transcriptional regulator/predicted RNase H-like HicB family nuclease
MRYAAILTKEGKHTLAEFRDCPGCQTFADPGESIEAQAEDALVGWLETHLLTGDAPPRPARKAPRGKVLWVQVPPKLAVKIALRWARQDAGLTQGQLAKRLGVSQQQVALLEKPDTNPTIDTLERAARALGARLEVDIHPGQ